jgi:hypothetical protein
MSVVSVVGVMSVWCGCEGWTEPVLRDYVENDGVWD